MQHMVKCVPDTGQQKCHLSTGLCFISQALLDIIMLTSLVNLYLLIKRHRHSKCLSGFLWGFLHFLLLFLSSDSFNTTFLSIIATNPKNEVLCAFSDTDTYRHESCQAVFFFFSFLFLWLCSRATGDKPFINLISFSLLSFFSLCVFYMCHVFVLST